jgi:hypothetical protein
MAMLPLCGMNGAIYSTVISFGVFFFLVARCCLAKPVKKTFLFMLAIAIGVNLLVWISWTPSKAAGQGLFFVQSIRSTFILLSASMFAYATDGIAWKSAIILGLVVTAGYSTTRKSVTRSLTFSDLIMTLVIVASLLVILAVAVGRAQTEHLIFHYGNLTLLIPIVSWTIVSKDLNGRVSLVVGLLMLLLFSSAYIANLEWRSSLTKFKHKNYQGIDYALNHEPDPALIVDEFRDEFIWSDQLAAEQKIWIVNSINTLRQKRYPIYTLKAQPGQAQ